MEGPAAGMIEDFESLASVVRREVVDELDHTSLNDRIENPTCERILLWIWARLAPQLAGLEELVLWETATSSAILRAAEMAP